MCDEIFSTWLGLSNQQISIYNRSRLPFSATTGLHVTQSNYFNYIGRFYLCWVSNTLTRNYILHGVMSCNLSLIFGRTCNCKTVTYIHIDQLKNSSQHVHDFNTYRFGRLIADWPVENINHDVVQYGCRYRLEHYP